MGKPSRFDSTSGMDFEVLKTPDDVTTKLEKTSDKLIVLLFNVRQPERFSLESRMKSWWKKFEKDYNVQFFKCTVIDGVQDIKTKFKVTDPPTVIFYSNNKEVERISNFEESDPDVSDTSKPGQESNDEKRLKERIEALSKK